MFTISFCSSIVSLDLLGSGSTLDPLRVLCLEAVRLVPVSTDTGEDDTGASGIGTLIPGCPGSVRILLLLLASVSSVAIYRLVAFS